MTSVMKPVMQTQVEQHGNCFAAAVASILELPLEDVPHRLDEEWLIGWRDWLSKHGLSIEWFSCQDRLAPRGFSVLSYDGGIEGGHAVVCFDGEVVHDPKGEDLGRADKAEKLHWYVFTVLNPREGLERKG